MSTRPPVLSWRVVRNLKRAKRLLFWIVVIASVTTVATGVALVYEDYADSQCNTSTDVFVMGVVAMLMLFAFFLKMSSSSSNRD